MLNSLSPFKLNTEIDRVSLNQALTTHIFQPCTTATPSTHGFIAPFAHSEDLAYELNNCLIFAFKIESKVIPASALKKEVAARVAKIEEVENRDLSKKEKDAIKEDAYQALVAKALTREEVINGYFDLTANLLLIGTASTRKAELVTVALRKALGSLKINVFETGALSQSMHDWVINSNLPTGLDFTGNGKVESTIEGDIKSTVIIKKDEFVGEEIIDLVANRQVKELGLTFNNQLSFMLSDELLIKEIKFTREFKDKADEFVAESEAERAETNFYIMSEVFRELFGFLMSLMNTEKAA
ncbi:recombination-associated protein RdgC [Cysteiniphilum marinum]|uniref:recombination-associated protein RdgC n=1 Tax=Cysteiniphilum marinum TaxID=2774191 RepID=UPI00193C02F3|nr:recombination-associated protein RdgC [Cysteiniphilum marinum]